MIEIPCIVGKNGYEPLKVGENTGIRKRAYGAAGSGGKAGC